MLVCSLLLFLLFFVTHSCRNFTVIGLSGFSINLSFPALQLSWGFSLWRHWQRWQCPPVTCTGTQAQYLDPGECSDEQGSWKALSQLPYSCCALGLRLSSEGFWRIHREICDTLHWKKGIYQLYTTKNQSLWERDKNYIGLMRLVVGKESFTGRLSKPIMLQHCFAVFYLELVDLYLLWKKKDI